MEDLSALSAKPRLRLLLDHFSKIKDTRQAWKVAYPLCEVLFLVVCGTIAGGDDYEDIVDWGRAHLSFLRGFAEFHYGIACADWLRTVMNRINPELFQACFSSWVAECWPDKLDLVAIDGKTSRRSHNRKTGFQQADHHADRQRVFDRHAADRIDGVEHAGLLDQEQRPPPAMSEAGADADALVLLADADEAQRRVLGERAQQAIARRDVR